MCVCARMHIHRVLIRHQRMYAKKNFAYTNEARLICKNETSTEMMMAVAVVYALADFRHVRLALYYSSLVRSLILSRSSVCRFVRPVQQTLQRRFFLSSRARCAYTVLINSGV